MPDFGAVVSVANEEEDSKYREGEELREDAEEEGVDGEVAV